MNEKLKKLSIKVEGLIDNGETPQLIYDDLTRIARKQKDYFTHLGPDNLIKLVFYIYSIKNTNNFDLGDKMINNLMFIKLIDTEGNRTVNSCDECGGDGYIRCEECGGNGTVDCSKCNGNGEHDCTYCDGDGEVDGVECDECEGSGEERCEECRGDGSVDCNYCSNGESYCSECDGKGEITSDSDFDFYIKSIVTWNRGIASVCELREDEGVPAMSEYDFDRLRDEYILLFNEESSLPLDINENEMYCIETTTEPELRFLNVMTIQMFNKRDEISHLLR